MKKTLGSGRLFFMAITFTVMLVVYGVSLYRLQIIQGEAYYEASMNNIVTTQTVTAARGDILDRYGRVLVSNKDVYNVKLNDNKLFEDGNNSNQMILEMVSMVGSVGDTYTDELPVTMEPPFEYRAMSDIERTRLEAYLMDRGMPLDTTAVELMSYFRTRYEIDNNYTAADMRTIAGVRYEINSRYSPSSPSSPYIFVQDASTDLISLLLEEYGDIIVVETSFIRVYETEYAAHLLGYVGMMDADEYERYSQTGEYSMDAIVGKDGVEFAFEEYLHGVDGSMQTISTSTGTVTNTSYIEEPIPGNHVYLTIDGLLQEATERALESGVVWLQADREAQNAKAVAENRLEDVIIDDIQGAAAVVVKVDTGEPLAIASYPTFDLSTLTEDWSELLVAENNPLFNRALGGAYAPGSTFKPVTFIAALTEGIINTETRIDCEGVYREYEDAGYAPTCWIWDDGMTHADLNVTEALRDSCNYFTYVVGNDLGVDIMGEFAHDFGLGVETGIELTEAEGNMANQENHFEYAGAEWRIGDTLQAGIGQSDSLFTPIQLAEYAAALANGGTRYSSSILKDVRSYDYADSLYAHEPEVLSKVDTADYNFAAIQEGMYLVAHDPMGSAYFDFYDYPITVAAKTGTSQLGEDKTNNAVFIAYAPYENPEIAVAIVVERGAAGSAAGSIARDIFDAYFSSQESYGTSESESELLK